MLTNYQNKIQETQIKKNGIKPPQIHTNNFKPRKPTQNKHHKPKNRLKTLPRIRTTLRQIHIPNLKQNNNPAHQNPIQHPTPKHPHPLRNLPLKFPYNNKITTLIRIRSKYSNNRNPKFSQ